MVSTTSIGIVVLASRFDKTASKRSNCSQDGPTCHQSCILVIQCCRTVEFVDSCLRSCSETVNSMRTRIDGNSLQRRYSYHTDVVLNWICRFSSVRWHESDEHGFACTSMEAAQCTANEGEVMSAISKRASESSWTRDNSPTLTIDFSAIRRERQCFGNKKPTIRWD